MNPSNTSPRQQAARAPDPINQTASEDAFHVPPIASPAAPDGSDLSNVAGAEAGHYGPAYGDPTRHLGGPPPVKPRVAAPAPQQNQASAPDTQQGGQQPQQ